MCTDRFYATLPAVRSFLDLANPLHYVDVPSDWYVLITDVAGSTAAIAAGRYKDINLMGASSIVAVLNAVGSLEIPFIFGGDGASFLVPPSYLSVARDALLGVRSMARQSFGLELRVGIVPVPVVTAQHALKIAKLRHSALYSQASFLGGGITFAADLIKADATYRLDVDSRSAIADLRGLECRWQEIPSPHGQTLSLLVAGRSENPNSHPQVYRNVLQDLTRIYGDARNYHPVDLASLKLSFSPRQLSAEVRARSPSNRRLSRCKYLMQILAENLLGLILMRLGIVLDGVDWGHYRSDLKTASDYQKIDDTLRMVISSSPFQTTQLIQCLEKCCQQGKLVYGLHISNRALITCLVFSRRDRHFHLIDGADGGYALAAKALKARLQRHPGAVYS